MTLVLDTGVMSAMLSHRRRPHFEPLVAKAAGSPVLIAPHTGVDIPMARNLGRAANQIRFSR